MPLSQTQLSDHVCVSHVLCNAQHLLLHTCMLYLLYLLCPMLNSD